MPCEQHMATWHNAHGICVRHMQASNPEPTVCKVPPWRCCVLGCCVLGHCMQVPGSKPHGFSCSVTICNSHEQLQSSTLNQSDIRQTAQCLLTPWHVECSTCMRWCMECMACMQTCNCVVHHTWLLSHLWLPFRCLLSLTRPLL